MARVIICFVHERTEKNLDEFDYIHWILFYRELYSHEEISVYDSNESFRWGKLYSIFLCMVYL